MHKINWGIIGCGDVTEVKSGPAFNKVKDSSLVAVMRRDEEKVKDYAKRHAVPKWYTDADKLINDPDINAIYVATPPSSHEQYVLAAMKAGKPVYVEKPMSTDAASAARIAKAAADSNCKIAVAHYRRAQPLFLKVKELIDSKAIGDIRFARIELCKKLLTTEDLQLHKNSWRVDTSVSGGGLFHDLAPHQLDLMYYFFGEMEKSQGVSANQAKAYSSDDIVSGNILFKSGVVFDGIWCFTVDAADEKDICVLTGEKGKIYFSIFENQGIAVVKKNNTETLQFDSLQHVQQPMIEKVVSHFLGEGPNPCSAPDGLKVMQLIDSFTQKAI
jgi:predicted dehydrogenase